MSESLVVRSTPPTEGVPPPMSLWQPANQTCWRVWPAAGGLSQRVAGNWARTSSMPMQVEGVLDVGMEGGVEEAVEFYVDSAVEGGDAERSDGVPCADHGDDGLDHAAGGICGAGKCGEEGGAVVGVAIGGEGPGDGSVGEVAGGQAAVGDESGEGAGGVGSAGEAEEVELVAVLIEVGDLGVGVGDLGGEADAHCAFDDFFEACAVGSDAVVVEGDLIGGVEECFVEAIDVGVAQLVLPGTVGTVSDSLGHSGLRGMGERYASFGGEGIKNL